MERRLRHNPQLPPTHLPPKPLDPKGAALMIETNGGAVWAECWEYVLSHRLTKGEAAAFWRGASIVHQVMNAAAIGSKINQGER